jgi:hypothetical protein
MILWVLRAFASAMLLTGIAAVLAGVVSLGAAAMSDALKAIGGVVLGASAVFIAGGAAALHLSRPRGFLLSSERIEIADADRLPVGGWLIVMAIALVALPVWMILRLTPFLSEWRLAVDALAKADIWQDAGSGMAGVVLIPLAAALTPPFIELVTMLSFAGASALWLPMLLSRSPRFPRIYLVSTVLVSALVIASSLGAAAVTVAAQAVERLVQESQPRAGEAQQVTDLLGRYSSAVTGTAPELAWTLCGYLVWLPLMVSSRRVRRTFAESRPAKETRGADLDAITSPDRFPG